MRKVSAAGRSRNGCTGRHRVFGRGLPGLTSVTTRPSPNTIRAEAKREDDLLAGEGTTLWPPTAQR